MPLSCRVVEEPGDHRRPHDRLHAGRRRSARLLPRRPGAAVCRRRGRLADLRPAARRARRTPGGTDAGRREDRRAARALPHMRRHQGDRPRADDEGRRVQTPVSDQGSGLLTTIRLPGGGSWGSTSLAIPARHRPDDHRPYSSGASGRRPGGMSSRSSATAWPSRTCLEHRRITLDHPHEVDGADRLLAEEQADRVAGRPVANGASSTVACGSWVRRWTGTSK